MFYLMKQNSMGTSVRQTFRNKDEAKKEMIRLDKEQSHVPYSFQLYYYILEKN